MVADAYVWRCLDGHEYAVTEEAMATSIIQQRCMTDTGGGTLCHSRLARRLRPFPPLDNNAVTV